MHVLRILLVVHVLQPVREDQGCACTAYVTGGPCYSQWERTRAVHVLRILLVVHVLQPVREDQGCACTAYITGGPCYSQ